MERMNVIITAGPTNEAIDAVMQITNMSTGALGARVTETMLGTPDFAENIKKIYYLSNKLARKPEKIPDGQADKLVHVRISDTDSLLHELERLLSNPEEHIDVVVHSAAVGDYKGRYAARAEDLAREISEKLAESLKNSDPADTGAGSIYGTVFDTLIAPACVQDSATKISSCEPNLMAMLDLTPKVIGRIKELSPDTVLFGFKLLENVPAQQLFDAASELRRKSKADYIVANDLSKIGNGLHPAFIIGYDNAAERDAVFTRCRTKYGIAKAICRLAFTDALSKHAENGRVIWQAIGPDSHPLSNKRYDAPGDAWIEMWLDFKRGVSARSPGIRLPDSEDIAESHTWGVNSIGLSASVGPMSADMWDGRSRLTWSLQPVEVL